MSIDATDMTYLNPLSANPIKWPNTFTQFVGKMPTNCLSLFGHFVNLALKGLTLPLVIIVFLVHQPYHQHLKGLYFE